MLRLTANRESWPLRGEFRISRGARTQCEVVVAEVSDGTHRGRGECVPYARYDEDVDGVLEAILSLSQDLAEGMQRGALQDRLPPGAARNAIDCALWDYEAKCRQTRAWQLAGLAPPAPVVTAYTLSLDTPQRMRREAAQYASRPLLKLKLGGEGDIERVRAVRDGAPASRLIIDANEGWSESDYLSLAPALAELGVAMIEQPLHAGNDSALGDLPRPIPVCADESCHDRHSLAGIAGRYDMVNIKLDKTGGLTEALAVRQQARDAGLSIMVGCMLATSLAMAPAVLLAQDADVVDLDGPLLMKHDREAGLRYADNKVAPPAAALWG